MVSRLKWIVVTILLVLSHIAFANSETEKVEFKTSEISVVFEKKTKKIKVELAENDTQHARGLMFRKSLGANEGMLFIFPDETIRSFWMKNTIIDLSIGYFNKDKKLIDIQEMKATSMLQKDLPSYPSRGPAKYALEMPAYWFEKNGIRTGATLKLKSEK